MYQYNISTGSMVKITKSPTGSTILNIGVGYSGAGHTKEEGRNNPDMISVANKGPIPPGQYRIQKPPYHHHIEGPCVMNLIPLPGTEEYDRSGFHLHGNDAVNNASHGCIIMGPVIRDEIAKDTDDLLNVVLS